ncbi:hypothetical protein PR002_g6277 [Phytophthora rubi]|uniref:Uncharacterized protein n=1 Tax=Phytophthora rubi TaxID=129364 RepID=A0A6A3MXU5_9STRA|nr:hypothetical protein PR002_g6277 [Phytophthora rubi]
MPKNSDICRACFSSMPDFYFKCKYCGVGGHPLTRSMSRLKPISSKTLRKYLAATTKAVEKAMAAVIPPDFGAMTDGWTCFGEHYVAVIAIF